MLRTSLRGLAAAGLLIMLHASPTSARVLTLSAQSDSTAIVRDAVDGDTAPNVLASPQARLLVEAGVLAADPVHHLVYVATRPDPLGAGAGGPSTVLAGTYGNASATTGTLDAPAGRYFVALAFDASGSRLLGIVVDPTAAAQAQKFEVSTNAGASFGIPTYTNIASDCCRFASGVAAWRATTQELFMLGRRGTDTEDQLLRFDFGGGAALPDAYPIAGGDRIVALAIDTQDGSLRALARSTLDFTYLARITYTTPGTPVGVSATGSAPAQCCYIAAGPATIDGSGSARALFALTRDAQTPAAMRLSRFDFVSGSPLVINAAMDGYGLWTDPTASLDRIFANGFD
jgi:hypothetical protein